MINARFSDLAVGLALECDMTIVILVHCFQDVAQQRIRVLQSCHDLSALGPTSIHGRQTVIDLIEAFLQACKVQSALLLRVQCPP